MPMPTSVTAIITYCPGVSPIFARGVAVVEIDVGGLDRELAAVRHGVARVDRQVEHGAFELVRIDMGEPQAAGQHGLQPDALAERAAQQFGHAGRPAR